jgi:hypothetical protein
MNKVSFAGASGRTYVYQIVSSAAPATPFPGNFLFVTLGSHPGIVYADEADSVFAELSSPNVGRLYETACTQHGATHICVHMNKKKDVREGEVRDLVSKHSPVLNV